MAALAALALPANEREAMVSAYRRRRDLAYSILTERGVHAFRPNGAFYMLIDIAQSGLGSYDFARTLIKETRVAVAPGQRLAPAATAGSRFPWPMRMR